MKNIKKLPLTLDQLSMLLACNIDENKATKPTNKDKVSVHNSYTFYLQNRHQ